MKIMKNGYRTSKGDLLLVSPPPPLWNLSSILILFFLSTRSEMSTIAGEMSDADRDGKKFRAVNDCSVH